MREVRKLRLLCIDDRPPSFKNFTEFDVMYVRSLGKLIDDWVLKTDNKPADIIICDVNMKERYDDHPSEMNLVWGKETDEPAYGPLLALPLLKMNSLCEFVPRSNYWPYVTSNGYVLVAVAIIRSHIEHRRIDISGAQRWIIENKEVALSTDPIDGVTKGLRNLRDRIKEACLNGSVSIAGIKSAIEAINRWAPGQSFEEIDGCPLHLEIVHSTGVDRIAIASLFAEHLRFGQPRSAADATKLKVALQDWYDAGVGFQFEKYDDIYKAAVGLLENSLPDSGVRLQSLAEKAKKESKRTGIDVYCLIRITMLFAFVRAWYFTHVNGSERFKFNKKQSFSKRKNGHAAWGVIDWAYWSLGINPDHDNPQNKFKRLLGTKGTPIRVSDEPHRGPFNAKYRTKVHKAYSCLTDDEAADLLALEKSLCLEFLKDDASFYPQGVEESEKLTWVDVKDVAGLPPFPKWLL